MQAIGIDVGSTATKLAIVRDGELRFTHVMPTGFSGAQAAETARSLLLERGLLTRDARVVATGYGRVAVPYADKVVTEIGCHGRGSAYLFGPDGVVVDVGGQDTKVIQLADGRVRRFVMNDKCSAGTGKFLEVMATRMGVTQERLSELAARGEGATISSMCTVFAESEVISLVGRGEPLENIAHAVIESVAGRVAALARQLDGSPRLLTGGLCDNAYVVARIGAALGCELRTCPEARFAGAIGAAMLA
ncbi:acyl-CoA dehydratase activase [Olsenella massiliensis]|uniref:acyl-CoA dehydratase activase n=1 Tax=Olsenella massiliensis TaxID=1622075 RepID=UPI00071C8F48|nr:acyl-CoA dehydratase activase [Olsenella massiliensis]